LFSSKVLLYLADHGASARRKIYASPLKRFPHPFKNGRCIVDTNYLQVSLSGNEFIIIPDVAPLICFRGIYLYLL
jgi:hypothetical protein